MYGACTLYFTNSSSKSVAPASMTSLALTPDSTILECVTAAVSAGLPDLSVEVAQRVIQGAMGRLPFVPPALLDGSASPVGPLEIGVALTLLECVLDSDGVVTVLSLVPATKRLLTLEVEAAIGVNRAVPGSWTPVAPCVTTWQAVVMVVWRVVVCEKWVRALRADPASTLSSRIGVHGRVHGLAHASRLLAKRALAALGEPASTLFTFGPLCTPLLMACVSLTLKREVAASIGVTVPKLLEVANGSPLHDLPAELVVHWEMQVLSLTF